METRIYGLTVGWKIAAAFFGAVGVAGGVAVIGTAFVPPVHHAWAVVVLGVVVMLMAVVFSIGLWGARIELRPDLIETSTVLFSKKCLRRYLRREDIGGKLFLPIGGGTWYIYPRSTDQKKLAISMACSFDQEFHTWIDGIPDVGRGLPRKYR